MTFLSHPTCSSGFIHDFMDHYTLEWQKAVSSYLLSEQILHYAALQIQEAASASEQILSFGLHGSRLIIGSNVGSIVYTSGYSPFIARRVSRVPLCPD